MSQRIGTVAVASCGEMVRGDHGDRTEESFHDWTGIGVKAILAKPADKMRRILAIAREGRAV